MVNQEPMLKGGEQIPTRENCNPNCPEEAFLWMLVGLPNQNGAPLSWPVGYLRLVSRRMWDCGSRPADCDRSLKVDAAPVVKYRMPSNGSAHWLTSPGSWHSVDDPDPAGPGLRQVLEQMPQADLAAVRRHLGLATEADERSEKVSYTKVDGSSVLVSRAQAAAWSRRRS